MVDSILSNGLKGIQNGVNSARQAAQDIASATTRPETFDPQESERPVDSTAAIEDRLGSRPESSVGADITEAVVQLKVSEQQVQASAAVVKTADEILGTLLDTKA